MEEESKKKFLKMCSNLSDYQLHIDCYILRMLYMNLMVTKNPKPIRNTQNIKRKKAKYNIIESHQSQGRETREEERNRKELQKQEMNKMAVSTYLSIMVLNVNGLTAPIKRHSSGVSERLSNLSI